MTTSIDKNTPVDSQACAPKKPELVDKSTNTSNTVQSIANSAFKVLTARDLNHNKSLFEIFYSIARITSNGKIKSADLQNPNVISFFDHLIKDRPKGSLHLLAGWSTPKHLEDFLTNSTLEEINEIRAFYSSGITPLLEALSTGRTDNAKILIEKGADLNVKDYEGKSPLVNVLINLDRDFAKYLIEKGADVREEESGNKNPLFYACKAGFEDVIELIITKDPSTIENNTKRTSLHYACEYGAKNVLEKFLKTNLTSLNTENINGDNPLIVSLNNEHKDCALLLIKQPGINLTKIDSLTKQSPLHIACEKGYEDVVKEILEIDTSTIDLKDEYFDTPLIAALKTGNIECAKMLIQHGADLTIAQHKTGKTPLLIAIENKFEDVVEEILKTDISTIDTEDAKGHIPIITALNNGLYKSAKLIVESGVNLTDIDYIEKRTPLLIACEKGYIEVVEEILLRNTSMLNTKDKCNNIPLIAALNKGHSRCAELLIINGADLTITDSNTQKTALFIACEKGFFDIVEGILEKDTTIINTTDNKGITPLLIALHCGYEQCAKLLVIYGADLTINDPQTQKTALLLACKKKFTDLIAEIINRDISTINIPDINGNYPFITLINNNDIANVHLLIKHGVDVNISDIIGDTPLHAAINNHLMSIVIGILLKDGNTNARNKNGISPLYLSIDHRDENLTQLLIKFKANITDEPDIYGNSIFSALLRNSNIELYKNLAESFVEQNDKIDFVKRDGYFNTPLHYACQNGLTSLLKIITQKIKPEDFISKNVYYETPFQLAFDKNLWKKSPKDMTTLLSTVLYDCMKNDLQPLTKEIQKDGILGLSQYLKDNILKVLVEFDSKQKNPLKIPLLLNDHELAQCMRKHLTKEKFQQHITNLPDIFKIANDDFFEIQNYDFEIDPYHIQMGLGTVPEQKAEGIEISDLLQIFDFHSKSNKDAITPKSFSNLSLADLKKILTVFTQRVKKRTVYTGTPRADQPEELERFYKTIEIVQTHVIKQIRGNLELEREVLKTLLDEVHFCGTKIYSVSLDLYFQICKGESSDFESKIYKALACLREGTLLSSIPRGDQNIHDKAGLIENLGIKCGIPGSANIGEHRDQHYTISIDRAEKGFFRRYSASSIINNIRVFLKEDDVKDLFSTWAEKTGVRFESNLQKYLKDSYEKISKNDSAESTPHNLKQDLSRLAKQYDDDAKVDDYLEEVLRAYLIPMCWMETDFEKITNNGDESFETLAPELKEIIEKCNLKGQLTEKFKGKHYGDETAKQERKKLFDKFCEIYGDNNLSSSQVAEVLVKLKVLKPVEL